MSSERLLRRSVRYAVRMNIRAVVVVALLGLAAFVSGQGTDLETMRATIERSGAGIIRDGRCFVRGGEHEFEVVAVSRRGDPVVRVGENQVAVMLGLLEGPAPAALAELPKLVVVAKAAGQDLTELRLRDVPLIGPHLSSSTHWVVPEGVAAKQTISDARSTVEFGQRARALIEALPAAPVNGLGQSALRHFLGEVGLETGSDEHVEPSFTRRLIRAGWLRRLAGSSDLVAALESVVQEADERRASTRYEGAGILIEERTNAFRDSTWILRTPARSGYALSIPAPSFLDPGPDTSLLVHCAPGTDPTAAAATPTRLEMWTEDGLLASWTTGAGLVASPDWQKVMDIDADADSGLLPTVLPPHLVYLTPDGDVRQLITAHGILRPVQDSTRPEIERFLEDAAKALPDAGHLDLIGQRLFRYVYDSPDVRFPELLGYEEAKGEIHQTAAETLANTVGGWSRGDCDDLAELYQEIAARQKRLGHLMNLPAHAAFGFAEERDGQWFVRVLQTGPPLEFSDRDLGQVLKKAYGAFGMLEAFDPDQIAIAVRFSGENVRSDYVLGSRIFQEPEYSAAMIDVQRDWHLHTYQRGITKMVAMIEAGDRDPANLRELSGLYERTAQHAEAAEYLRQSLAASGDPTLGLTIRLIDNLFEAKDIEGARKTARAAIDDRMPTLQKQLGMAFGTVALQFIAVLAADGRAIDLATEVCDRYAIESLARQLGPVMNFLGGRRFSQEVWDQSMEMTEVRASLRLAAVTLTDLIRRAGPDALLDNESLRRAASFVETWIQVVSPRDVSDRGDRLFRISEAAAYACVALSEEAVVTQALKAAPPKVFPEEFGQRLTGLGQFRADLPWFRISVPFWSSRLYLLFERSRTELDRSLAARYIQRVIESRAEAKALGIDHFSFDLQEHLARLISALLNSNEAELSARFEHVARQGDKSLTDETARMLGTVARFVDPSFFQRALELWHSSVDHPPSAFAIAWTAMGFHAKTPALAAARAATLRYPSEPAFTEELRGLELLSAKTP